MASNQHSSSVSLQFYRANCETWLKSNFNRPSIDPSKKKTHTHAETPKNVQYLHIPNKMYNPTKLQPLLTQK